jgi:hypothetical protein
MTTHHPLPTLATDDELRDAYDRPFRAAPPVTNGDVINGIRAARRAVYDLGTNDGFAIAHFGMAAQLTEAARETAEERQRQDAKWGEQNHPDGTGPIEQPLFLDQILGAEGWIHNTHAADELARVFTKQTNLAAEADAVTWTDILLEEVFEALAESDPVRLRKELIQVAAVAQQWVEAIDRRAAPVLVIHNPTEQPADGALPH